MSENQNNDRFIRWQTVTREQLSSVSNLILGLATGLLAFQSTLLLEHKLNYCCSIGFGISSLILLIISVTSAIWCSINRLQDFRLTARIARNSKLTEEDRQGMREEVDSLGKFTWVLFWFQVGSFALGAVCSSLAVIIQVFSK